METIITQGVLYISLIFSSGNGEEQRWET